MSGTGYRVPPLHSLAVATSQVTISLLESLVELLLKSLRVLGRRGASRETERSC